MIKISNLSKYYSSNKVFDDLNLTFSRGRIHGIMGDNGAGKTSLFKCIAGLEDYNGEVVSDFQPLKNHLGFLMTEPYFFKKMTGEEYVELLCLSRDLKIENINTQNIFDLSLNKYISTYSTGMKKKLAITAILAQNNEYYMFDEPFNGIDMQGNILLSRIILQLKKLNKVVIISSHIFSILIDLCDEIFVLNSKIGNRIYLKDEFASIEREIYSVDIEERIKKLNIN